MHVICGNCGARLKVPDDLGKKRAKCPKCKSYVDIGGSSLTLRESKIPPATRRQKEFARLLGVEFPEEINRKDLSALIDEAIEQCDDERLEKLAGSSDRESESRQQIRDEILAEIDEGDCRLSKATPTQVLEELARRDLGAILISFDLAEAGDFQDLTGVELAISFSDNMTGNDTRLVLGWLSATMFPQEQQ
jgi:hypothetical protein